MKAFKLLLFICLSLFNHGHASKLAAPSEMLAMYNAYVSDFLKNGATRTLGPKLDNAALVDFGTFVSHVYDHPMFPRNGIFLSQTPEYSKDTLGQIDKFVGKKDSYYLKYLLRDKGDLSISHSDMLKKLSDTVKSTRGSTASGFSDAWEVHFPEFKRALADVSYVRENWGLTLKANNDPVGTMEKYKTWQLGLQKSTVRGARSYTNHQKITSTITDSLSQLDSLDSCD